MRCFEAEAFSGSVVEVVHGDKDFFFCDEIEAHFLWEELERIKPFMFSLAPRSQEE